MASTLLYVYRLKEFSRGMLPIFYGVTVALLSTKYALSQAVFDQLSCSGYNIKHEIVIGRGGLAKQYRENVASEPEQGLSIEEMIDPTDVGAVAAALVRDDIDEAVIALEADEYRYITALISLCEKDGVKYMVIPFYNNLIPARPVIGKVVSGLGLVILGPLLLALAIGVRLSSPGPILFRQVRVGYN